MIISNFQKCKKRNYICVIIFLTAQHHDQTQTSIFGGSTCQIAGRNINNLRYTDDTTHMAESVEELTSPLMKMKEENEKVGLKFKIQKTTIMSSSSSTSWQIGGEATETVTDMGFPGGSEGKRLPTMQETQVPSLGQEDPLEKGMATHSSTLAWKIPWTEKSGRLQSMGSQRAGHD